MSNLYNNFSKFKENQEVISVLEFPLYTDNPRIIGAIESQPISLLNPIIHNNKGIFLPRIILRYFNYSNGDEVESSTSKSKDSKFKSQDSAQKELSYLINLRLGIRTIIGSCMREFILDSQSNDNYGFVPNSQYYPNYEKEILLNTDTEYPIIPNLFKDVCIGIDDYFFKLLSISEIQLHKVIRAAKLYSNALFLVEKAPRISWILLVSAIEVAAESKKDKINHLDLVNEEFPKLYELIKASGNAEAIFKELENVIHLKPQQKFINFINRYYSFPPRRTDLDKGYLIDWDNFNDVLKTIYKYRSKALHSIGIGAFPREMCLPPFKILEEKTVVIEKEWNGGTVEQKEAPMNLAKFEEIVRVSLLNWIEET